MAHHDALTDLPNRVLLAERLEQALLRVGEGEALAVLCVDLDRFKEINDALGHTFGDALLQAVAARLRSSLRETDTVARMGGDEFVILQIGDDQAVEATMLATRVIEALSAPFTIKDHQMVVGASVGIALSPTDGTEPEQLLKNADIALYRSKSEGRGTYRFFEKGMDIRMQARRALEMDLRKALVNGEFELHYQPIHELGRDELSGFEALLRWRHPQRGMVSPDEIIPLAEETGFIVPVGEWVLRQACADAAQWPSHLKIAVNLSPKQFKNQKLVQTVASAIVASGLIPSRLELEITETVLLSDGAATLDTLKKLQNFGVRIALDDFGTGYSSLSYLRSFPFNKIKIDKSFITGLSDGSAEAVAIVRAVSQMGLSLGMSTTAEGVETEAQLAVVRAEGCTEVQGYLFSGPKPAHEITMMLDAKRRAAELTDAA
jgi:diguanylate cyclase (GGDEF)-like protein